VFGFDDIAILGAGVLLIALGLGGMAPVLFAQRRALTGRLRIDETLNPALSAATAVVRPWPPLVGAPSTGSKLVPSGAEGPVADEPEVENAAAIPVAGREVPIADELLARLFAIRMLVSDVTEEIHTLRDGYDLDDDEIVEDIDDADDDLSDIDEDMDPDEGVVKRRSSKVREAA
jgi:hypothetical protein